MTEQWTNDEERSFKEMQERRERVLAKRREPVAALVRKTNGQLFPSDMTEWLIANADEIRDALAPYDSGIRVEVSGVAHDTNRT